MSQIDKTLDNNIEDNLENKKETAVVQLQNHGVVYFGEYYSVHTRQYHPCTQRFIERETERLINFANQDDSITIQRFWLSGGYNRKQFYEWIKKFPHFAEAHEYAMTLIGARREEGAIYRKFEPSTIQRTLGRYNHIWKEETHELAKLKDDVAQNETKVIVIERFPELPVSTKTPEEVAMAVRKATSDDRNYGPYGEREKK